MGGRLARIVAAIALPLVLAGCQRVPGSSSSGTAANECTPDTVHQVVNRFIAAFNGGDLGQLDQLFAGAREGFHWYATDAPGQRFDAEASNRDTLMGYFAARHSQHEHLVLNSLDLQQRQLRKGEIQCVFAPSVTTWAMDPHPWSPVELLPEAAAALLLLAVAAVAVFAWRRTARS